MNKGLTPYAIRLLVEYEAKKLRLRKIKVEIGNYPEKLFCLKTLGVIFIDREYLTLPFDILRLLIVHELNHIKIYRLLRNNKTLEERLQQAEDENIIKIFKKMRGET